MIETGIRSAWSVQGPESFISLVRLRREIFFVQALHGSEVRCYVIRAPHTLAAPFPHRVQALQWLTPALYTRIISKEALPRDCSVLSNFLHVFLIIQVLDDFLFSKRISAAHEEAAQDCVQNFECWSKNRTRPSFLSESATRASSSSQLWAPATSLLCTFSEAGV